MLVASSCKAALAGRPDELPALNRVAEVSIVPPSIRRASREMGEQLLTLGATWVWGGAALKSVMSEISGSPEGWHHCVAFGLLGALAGGEPEEVLTAYLHQAALGVIGAGVRAIPVGHTHGQQVLAYLHNDIQRVGEGVARPRPRNRGRRLPLLRGALR